MIGGTSVWFNWDTYRIGTVKEGRGGQEKILIAIILLPTAAEAAAAARLRPIRTAGSGGAIVG
jgi:hypothetical protein